MTEEAVGFIDQARKEDITLRLMGAIAFQIHCPSFQYLSRQMGRILTDIDFVGREAQRDRIVQFFKKKNIETQHEATTILLPRLVFQESSGLTIDVFLDRLEMCHKIDFSTRLEVDYPTLAPADLLLEKLQIVKINTKDVTDVIMLLREHDIGASDEECINLKYVSSIISNDWGFYHTVVVNLQKIRDLMHEYQSLKDEDKEDLDSKIAVVLRTLEKSSKSLGWRLRARVGERQKWYADVEDVLR